MGTLLGLSLRQMTGGRRLALLAFLAVLPVGLAVTGVALGATDDTGYQTDFVNAILDGMIVGVVLPIVVMTLATAAFGHELEDRTLNVLVLKPVARAAIVLPKVLGSVLVAGPLMAAAGIAVVLIGFGDGGLRAALAVGAALLVGVIAYGTAFTWAGLVSSRAMGFVLVYVFLWEGLVTTFLSGVRYLSIRQYTLSIMHGLDPDTFAVLANRTIGFNAALIGAVLVAVIFFFLTVRRLQRMDVP